MTAWPSHTPSAGPWGHTLPKAFSSDKTAAPGSPTPKLTQKLQQDTKCSLSLDFTLNKTNPNKTTRTKQLTNQIPQKTEDNLGFDKTLPSRLFCGTCSFSRSPMYFPFDALIIASQKLLGGRENTFLSFPKLTVLLFSIHALFWRCYHINT